MTCLEKFLQENPECNAQDTIDDGCPHWYFSAQNYCQAFERGDHRRGNCSLCWGQSLPTETVTTDSTPVIKDSGERREFPTGAVRDIQEGKGRCDLMPLEVVASVINGTEGAVLGHIAMFRETSTSAELYLALAKFANHAYSGSRPDMLLEVSKHFEEGAKKYGENNWQKGLPINCYIDSAVRHYLKWLRGDKDEPHDRAFVWNLMCCIWTCDFKPELNNNEEETK